MAKAKYIILRVHKIRIKNSTGNINTEKIKKLNKYGNMFNKYKI